MTHPNFQTNGASLEDCHTNFFALTELSGIKWRKLVWSESDRGGANGGLGGGGQQPPQPLDDPILRSYASCLAADILCVWRRVSAPRSGAAADMFDLGAPQPVQLPAQPPPLSLSAAKELWIFWYGEEPDLNELVAPELNMNDCEQGAWESGLSYECRSLLFKALHNLIERCLLSRDFVRLGKWFVQPTEPPPIPLSAKKPPDPHQPQQLIPGSIGIEHGLSSPGTNTNGSGAGTGTATGVGGGGGSFLNGGNGSNSHSSSTTNGVISAANLSFSFAFFVHGESSVCASVDVRQHPPVRRLTRWHVQQAQASSTGLKVILAPFGLAGTLTGQTYKSPEVAARLLEDWSHFYPLDKTNALTESGVVEVSVGGSKMRYPACYVLVTDMDDEVNSATINNGGTSTSTTGGGTGCGGGGAHPSSPLRTTTSVGTSANDERINVMTMTASDNTNTNRKRPGSPVLFQQRMTPPLSPVRINSRVPQPGPYTVSVEHINSMSREPTAATVLPEQTWQECILGRGLCCGQSQEKEFSGNWDFVEPTRRTNCTCSKCRTLVGVSHFVGGANKSLVAVATTTTTFTTNNSNNNGSGRASTTTSHNNKAPPSQLAGGVVPFHRRSTTMVHQQQPLQQQQSERCLMGSYTPQGGPPSYPPRTQESTAIPSDSSPPSAAPSPLQNPNSQQPASVPPMGEQTMPTLSPHHPQTSSTTPTTTASLTLTTPGGVSATSANLASPSSIADKNHNTPPSDHHHHHQPIKSMDSSNNSNQNSPPGSSSGAGSSSMMPIDQKSESMTSSSTSSSTSSNHNTPTNTTVPVLKRPILTSKEYEVALGEEEQTLEMLYDYSTLDAWLNHPVKKFKPDGKENQRLINSRLMSKTDIYSIYDKNYNNMNANNHDGMVNGKNMQMINIKQEIKQECGQNMDNDTASSGMQHPHGIKRPGDPYEFDEEGGASNCNMDGFKRGQGGVVVKEENKDVKKGTTDSLFTSEGLLPSIKDLDQIFDNSDNSSSDEAMQVQTPPGQTSMNHQDDSSNRRFSGHHGGPTTGILRPEELSQMFPTPPSLEHNPIASPCGQLDLPPPQEYTDLGLVRLKQEIYPNMGSPQEENIEDWSYVFKPPTICKLVGSSKYAPLTNLPSQNLPPVVIPPNCTYKPSWMQQQHHVVEKSVQSTNNTNNSSSNSTNTNNNNTQASQNAGHINNNNNNNNALSNNTSSVNLVGGGVGGLPPGVVVNSLAGGPLNNSLHPHHQSPAAVAAAAAAAASLFPASPLHHHGGPPGFRPPPPPYEMPSPATSTASSYLNKNLNSVEPVSTPIIQRIPEASSLTLNILLTDTTFNIFRDHNFDSCTLCVCNAQGKVVGNIRGADAGIYLLSTPSDKQHASARPGSPPYGVGNVGQPPPYGGGGMMHPHPHHQHHQQQHQHHHHQDDSHCIGGSGDEDSIRCSCGFSAVVNRRLAHGSGLFYEDEMEITGIAEDPGDKKKPSLLSFVLSSNSVKLEPNIDRDQVDTLPHNILELVREQLVFIPSTTSSLCRAARYLKTKPEVTNGEPNIHILDYSDGDEVTGIALEQSRSCMMDLNLFKMEEMRHTKNSAASSNSSSTVHRWPFLRASGPQCNQDIIRIMRNLQPLLQEAIQKKCQTRLWEAPSAVKGPLTWRQFHRLAGRGTDDRCEPQPIPSVIVGHDKDWLSLSPYALQHWESLLLEPYSYARDVAYIVVAPDNEAILQRVRIFFKELSTAYEMCKLGRHSPITKVLRDGILRVGKTAKSKIGNEPVEDWFTLLGESETTDMLKLYAQVCKHHLAPHLQQVPMDKTLLDPPQENADQQQQQQPAPSPMPPPSTPDNTGVSSNSQQSTPNSDSGMKTPKSDQDVDGLKDSPPISNVTESFHDDDEREVPSVVVYLVEPFTLGSDQPELQRLACLALLRCYQSILAAVPEHIRNNISVQIISLESIVELNRARDRMRHSDHMRALAFNIFSQCRRLLVHTNNVKSLTGFGTAAMADYFLKGKDEKNRAPYKLFTPPYILAPMRGKVEGLEAFGKGTQDQASVLYLSYCLSEDQSWLLAVATDERGEIFETITINIDIPNRSRRKKASARRIGLEKLMNFILGVMSQSVRPWRLVVGRLGRIGHGELKGWSWLLGRKNLLKASKHLKEICNQCSMMYPNSVPCILSACLVSLEPDSVLRLMPDQFTPDERFSQVSVNSQLSTPQDVTCTHILVFPTSATTQSSQTAFQEQHITNDFGEEELFSPFDEEMPEGMMPDDDFTDIFNWTEIVPGGGQSPPGSPRREESGTGSPNGCGIAGMGREGASMMGGMSSRSREPSEEVGTVLQQPLALGYFVSTAPTGKMPKWFWSSCPHLEGVCPAFLKNALHLHSPSVQQSMNDEFFQQSSSSVTSHPLDSQYTTDVLRYVLEGYNALSWLALDSNTKDRLSCLPVHMQVLVQLYNTAAALL